MRARPLGGQLTPATSSSLLPLVREAEKLGRITAAWAKVKGSRFAADITLQVQKAEEVPNSWPTADDTTPLVSSDAGPGPAPGAYAAQRELVPPPKIGGAGVVGLIYWCIVAKRHAPRGAPRTIGD